MTTRQCNNCNEILPTIMFEIIKKATSSYFRKKCKQCRLHETQEQRNITKQRTKQQITHKQCTECVSNLEVAKFNKKALSKDGFDKVCRDCYKIIRHRKKQQIQSDVTELYCVKCKSNKSHTEFRTNARSSIGLS